MLDGMSDSIQGSRIENLHSREVDCQSPTGLIFSFFSSIGFVKFLFCFFLFAVVLFRKFMLPIGKMNIKYQTNFRYLIVGIWYFLVFQIPTSVSVLVFSNI